MLQRLGAVLQGAEVIALVLILILLAEAALIVLVVWEFVRDSHFVEQARRWWCRRFDHAPVSDERARPVTAFVVCRRCGKVGARLP